MKQHDHNNPFWFALYFIDKLMEKVQNEGDLVALCDASSEFQDLLGRVATMVGKWEKDMGQDFDAKIKACYLLGLAVGLKYRETPDETLDKIIADYKETK